MDKLECTDMFAVRPASREVSRTIEPVVERTGEVKIVGEQALERGAVGSYHHVSKKYLPFYLNEFSFRHNNRKNVDIFADLITTCGQ